MDLSFYAFCSTVAAVSSVCCIEPASKGYTLTGLVNELLQYVNILQSYFVETCIFLK